jgi:hypothetical protein
MLKMRGKMKKLIISIFGIFIFGCATHVPYQPTTLKSKSEAEKTVRRIILEQPRPYAPVEIQINDEYFQIFHNDARKSLIAGGVTAVPIVDTLYFDSINAIELYKKRTFFVLIKDKDNNARLYVFTRSAEMGKLFIDAMSTLVGIYNNK